VFQESLSRRRFFKTGAGALLAASAVRAQTSLNPLQRPPNVVLILCDDLGYGDLHSYGSSIPTPNLDQMAQEGVQFRQFYAASNVCSPSRAALMTGRYAPRVGVPDVLASNAPNGLSLSEKTLADVLKPAGYTSMCVGKWHLGSQAAYMPRNRGFDAYYGIPYSNDMSPSVLIQNGVVIESPVQLDTITQRYTQQSVNFIANSKDNPFFLYLAHTFPHIPLAASPAFKGKSPLGLYGDVIQEIDWSVGQILQSLKDNGVDNNTLVMFSSDNGPWYQGSPGRLRGRKGWSYEGGVREPFIARFPGQIPATPNPSGLGRVSNAVGTMMDIFPTIARLTGASLPDNPLDGVDLWPVLSGQVDTVNRDVFLYFDSNNLQCARYGQWKLHISRYNDFAWSPDPVDGRYNLPLASPELYNLELDPEESFDMAADNPDVVADIMARVQKLLPTFPQAVQDTWKSTMSQQVYATPAGALPVRKPPQQ
jgi:arylsulfatase A